ncbi:N2227-like protein-domain-containing protein [Amylostereum chailletii]|nr:N2227-like protein-domain-containing protein [Amylostereum chailletii]
MAHANPKLAGNNRRRKDLFTLPRADQELLASIGYKEKLLEADQAILANARFLREIVASPEIFGIEDEDENEEEGGGDLQERDHAHAHGRPGNRGHGHNHGHPHEHEHGHPHDQNRPHDHGRGHGPSHDPRPPREPRQRGQSHSHDHGHPHDHSHDHARPSHSHDHGGPSTDHAHSHGPATPSRTHSHDPADPARSHDHGSRAHNRRYKPTDFDMDKLRSTLKQFVRDWSVEGLEEREASYKPVKDALVAHFASTPLDERHKLRVLVPGAGLGRLAFDVAKLGFTCQGNEFSQYMLLSSYFILNRTERVDEHTIYPYVHSFSNIPNRAAALHPVRIPDVLPGEIPPNAKFSLVAGDFEEIFGAEITDPADPSYGLWDAVLTCFFIDTAKNIVNYLRIIHKLLAPGGVWINIGPLLWHFENNTTNDASVELDLEEVKALARALGFDISNERTVDTTYVSNKDGMLDYIYHATFWTATKRA